MRFGDEELSSRVNLFLSAGGSPYARLLWEAMSLSNEGWLWAAVAPFFFFFGYIWFTPLTLDRVKIMYGLFILDLALVALAKFFVKRTRPAYNKVTPLFSFQPPPPKSKTTCRCTTNREGIT